MSENNFPAVKPLRRTRDGRVIAGVASGLGRYIGIDPNIIRVAFAVATFFGGLGVAIYVIGWLLLPDEGKARSIAQDLIDKNRDNPVWVDTKTKVEQGWTRATGQWGPQNPAPPAPPAPGAPFPPQAPHAPGAPFPPQAPPAPPAPQPPRETDGPAPQA